MELRRLLSTFETCHSLGWMRIRWPPGYLTLAHVTESLWCSTPNRIQAELDDFQSATDVEKDSREILGRLARLEVSERGIAITDQTNVLSFRRTDQFILTARASKLDS
jgi:hypothetical protein